MLFDYWTKGIHNFIPIARELTKSGYSVKLLHLGSWRDRAVPTTEIINDLECIDIAEFGGDIRKGIESLCPSIVVMLNTTMTVDRTVNRICRSLGIKTVYLMHGIKAVGDDLDEFVRHQNIHWTLKKRFSKVPKYASLVARYLGAIARDNPVELFSPATYGHFVQLAASPGSSHQRPWPHKDVYCDLALVYANVYRNSLIGEASYPAERVKVVGNPNLDSVFRLSEENDAKERAAALLLSLGVDNSRRVVAYMEDGFVEQGIGSWTEQTRLTELREIAASVRAAGFDLIIKMHPGSNPDAVLREFAQNPHVRVVLTIDLALLLCGCAAVIGHISTTLMVPIALGLPLIVPTWSPGLERYSYYVGQGAAIPARTPNDLVEILLNLHCAKNQVAGSLDAFIESYITFTDGRSLDRIVRHIIGDAETVPS